MQTTEQGSAAAPIPDKVAHPSQTDDLLIAIGAAVDGVLELVAADGWQKQPAAQQSEGWQAQQLQSKECRLSQRHQLLALGSSMHQDGLGKTAP